MTQDDDSPKTDDRKTAMQRYAAWHTKNCRCIPSETAHDTDAARRDGEAGLMSALGPSGTVDLGHFSAYN